MTALWVLLGLVALLLMLAWMPVGAAVTYDSAFRVRVQVGFLRFTVYPAPEKGKKEKKGKKKQSEAKMEKKPFSSPNRRQIRYSVDTLVPALWRALVRFGRRIRVPLLRLHVAFGGEDPADVAVLYGKSQLFAYSVHRHHVGVGLCTPCGSGAYLLMVVCHRYAGIGCFCF